MTSIPKNVDIDKLDDVVNQYNNTQQRTIKTCNNVNQAYILTLIKKIKMKIQNLKLVTM